MIGDTQLSYRLSRWTLLILLLSVIPLVCLPVRAQEQESPAVTMPIASDPDAATDLADPPAGTVGEAANETDLRAGNRPDR